MQIIRTADPTTCASSAPARAAGWPQMCSRSLARASWSSRPGPNGIPPPIRPCSDGRTSRPGAAQRRPSATSASSTAASAAGSSTASRTPSRRGSSGTGIAPGCSAVGPTTGAGSRCAGGPTTSAGRAWTASVTTGRSRYDDLKPYYDKLDRLVGIFGTNFAAERNLPNEPDGIFMPPPKPRCYELAIQQASEKPEHPVRPVAAVDPHAAAQRPPAMPLLRPVRPRLLDALELLVDVRAAAAGNGDRPPDARRPGDGARGDDRRRAARRRALPTSTRRPTARAPRACPHRRGRGEHVRDDADPAQLEIGAAPERARRIRAACSAGS